MPLPQSFSWFGPLLFRRGDTRILQRRKVAFLAAGDEAFGDRLQLLPAEADFFRLVAGDLIVSRGGRNDREEVGELLHDLVGGGDQKVRVSVVGSRVLDEEAAGALANPLHEPSILGAVEQALDPVEGIDGSAAARLIRGFGPFVNQGERQSQFRSDMLGAAVLQYFAQQFVGVHDADRAPVRTGWQGERRRTTAATAEVRIQTRSEIVAARAVILVLVDGVA